ncbi:hypothetical protein [Ruminococcus sp. 5_1_39BFAA]|uniref:hypothetical protein n=1 Tax=Ruminococcus sp. 5_1_39BFAA TaxID=457412 RepID=UPI003564C061
MFCIVMLAELLLIIGFGNRVTDFPIDTDQHLASTCLCMVDVPGVSAAGTNVT